MDMVVLGLVIGVLDTEDMVGPDYLIGFIKAQASAQIAGQDINLKIAIEI